MKKTLWLPVVFSLTCFLAGSVTTAKEVSDLSLGERLFIKHCSKCHPSGGNIVTVTKTLNPSDRKANNIRTEEDIVKLMRSPGPGMVKFGKELISEKDAKAIAKYILETFK